LPINKFIEPDNIKTNLIENAEWTLQNFIVNDKVLTMLTTPIAIPKNHKLTFSCTINGHRQTKEYETPFIIDLYNGTNFDLPENDINFTYEQLKNTVNIEHPFIVPEDQTNVSLRIFHYYPDYQISGDFKLFATEKTWKNQLKSFLYNFISTSTTTNQEKSEIIFKLELTNNIVLLNYDNAPKKNSNNQFSDYIIQSNDVLVKIENTYKVPGTNWCAYKKYNYDKLIIGENLLSNNTGRCVDGAIKSNGLYYTYRTGEKASAIIWSLGNLPKGLYLMTLSALYKHAPPPYAALKMHLMDKIINTPYPRVIIKPTNALFGYKLYKTLLYYPGCETSTRLRVFSSDNKPYDINSVGIYPIELKK